MRRIFLFSIILFISFVALGQDTTVTIYFKSGQSALTSKQQNYIDNLQLRPVTKITIDGYADTIGKASFNKKLSYKRAKTTAGKIKTENKIITGNGECNEKKVAMDKMRKVIIKVWYDKPLIEEEIIAEKKTPAVQINQCTEDTTIYSESGTMIQMNKCYYLKNKDCFKYKEYRTAASVQQAGLRTIDEGGNPIESGGMIDINFCSDTCIKKPVIVFLPVPECMSKQPMTLWTINRNNTWRNSQNKIEIVNINGKEFYRMEIYCPGRLNCDQKKTGKKNVKVKLQRGLNVKSATLSYDCPLYCINGKYSKKRRKIIFPYVCPQGDPVVYIKAFNKTGDTLIINNKNINQFTRKRSLISSCRCNNNTKVKFLGVFKTRQKYLYRKYKIYKRDFDLSKIKA